MKSKRISTIAFSAVFALTLALALAFSFGVNADKTSAISANEKLFGYEYDADYVLKDLGVEKIGENTSYTEGRKVEYVLEKENGQTIDPETEGYAESFRSEVGSTIIFKRPNALYRIFVTDNGSDETAEYPVVSVKASDVDAATHYDPEKIADYASAVKEYAKDLSTTSTFKFSELEKKVSLSTIAKKDCFDILKTKVTVNYALPGASSVSSTSGSSIENASFKTTKPGEYSFYFTFTDELNNVDKTDDLIMGDGGYYSDENDNGEWDDGDKLVIPVFTFTIEKASKPEVSLTTSEKAYIGLEYKIDCFNVTASDYTTEYKLYFIPSSNASANYDKDAEKYDIAANGDSLYIADVLANPDVKDVTELLDTSSMKFKPEEKGYYYALLDIYSNNGYGRDEVMSYAIACLDEYTEVVTEKQFFKYNATSIIFLSISALSFIGIIVVLCIKPKQQKELETKSDNS